jgi:hypothetical protein
VWRRRKEAASARLSAAPYSAHHKLYSEAVVSSAAALAEVGRFREAVEYVQRAARALYEAAKEVFEQVKVTVQRLVKLFVEAVTRVLAWVDEHKAYLFLMAAVAAGVVALSAALNLWGLAELEKLAHAAMGASPFFPGRTKTGEKVAEWFKTLAERYEGWINANVVDEILKAPLNGERPFSKLTRLKNLPKPLVELRRALINVKGEVEKDAVVVAALVLYKTLINNAEAYREWAGWYGWARGLVGGKEFTVATEEVKRLREAQRRLEGVAGRVLEELNRVLVLYSQSGFYKETDIKKLKSLLEVNLGEAEELAKARSKELSKYSDANMGTKAYAALLSLTRGGIYGHTAMLLMGEGALADIVLSTPATTHRKAGNIAKMRGDTVEPSYSRRKAKAGGIAGRRGGAVEPPHVEVADWGDRAASVLLRFLIAYGEIEPRLLSGAGEVSLKFRLVEKEVKKDGEKKRVEGGVERGFQVFRVYGGVEAPVGELWIGDVAYFKIGKEELRRLVEEAKREAPDLSGVKKIWQTLEWFATDVTFDRGQIEGGTAHLWQLRWYLALFGGGRVSGGRANVTEEGIRPFVIMRWRRERLDSIIAEEGNELKPLLGRTVKSWRELVDAIDWRWVLERVRELTSELKPWIGPEEMDNTEREGLVRRMLGELALFVHFAEARRGMDDDRWREERAKRLAEAVEALSGGRIAGDYAERLAGLIMSYAERHGEETRKRIENLAKELTGVSWEEVWGVVDFVLSDMYCLARDCADDKIIRKFVAPALELIMLDKALRGEFDRERAKLIFGEMYTTAVAGDGTVGPDEVMLAVGGELGGGAALLRLATLHLLNGLLPDELKLGVRVYVEEGTYRIDAYGEDAARLKRLLVVSAPSSGGGYLSDKFDQFVEAAKVEVRVDNIRLTESGYVAADLIISEAGVAVKYNVYLREDAIELQFQSTDRSHVELAARLLRLAGVNAEVKKREGKRDVWYIVATTDKLAAGREEFRKALAEIVETARKSVGEEKAKRWLEKLEEGLTLREGWPKYHVGLSGSGGLMVRFASTDPDSIVREVQRLRQMGLEEGVHFTAKMPEGGKAGYVYILKGGLAYAAWLSKYGSGKQQRLVAGFVEYILQRAGEEGENVRKRAEEIVEEGKAWGSLTLEGFVKEVEVDGKKYVVKVIDGGAEFDVGRGGKLLLRIRITAEVDGIRREYVITYGRYGAGNKSEGFAMVKADTPGDREADAERLAAVIKALTGKEPRIHRMKDGGIKIVCYREHLEGFMRFAELAAAIAKWLKETSR